MTRIAVYNYTRTSMYMLHNLQNCPQNLMKDNQVQLQNCLIYILSQPHNRGSSNTCTKYKVSHDEELDWELQDESL